MNRFFIIAAFLFGAWSNILAQSVIDNPEDIVTEEKIFPQEAREYNLKLQIYRYVKPYIHNKDTMWCYLLPEVVVYPPLQFKNKRQRRVYNQLVYNVKKVLPLAQKVNSMITETYEILESLPDKKSKDEHM